MRSQDAFPQQLEHYRGPVLEVGVEGDSGRRACGRDGD